MPTIAAGPVGLREALRCSPPAGVQQRAQASAILVLGEVQLVVDVERLDAGHQPMVGIRDPDPVRLDRGVGHELAAQRVGPHREAPR